MGRYSSEQVAAMLSGGEAGADIPAPETPKTEGKYSSEQAALMLGQDEKTGMSTFGLGNRKVTVHPSLGEKLLLANADMVKATGYPIVVNESFRTREKQAEYYKRYQEGRGGRAAPPGLSRHEKGLAVDIQNWQQAAPFLKKYGIENPLADDRNHFQFANQIPETPHERLARMEPTATAGGEAGYGDVRYTPEVRQAMKPYVKGTLTAAGMTAGSYVGGAGGGLAGTALAPGPGTAAGAMTGRVVGAGVGYELGDIAADLINGDPHDWEKSGEHIRSGMGYGLGGELLSEVIVNPALKYGRAGWDKLKGVFTGKTAQARAGEALSKVESGLTEQEIANRERAQELEKRLGVKLTPAQRTGNIEQAMLEQGIATDPKVANVLAQLESAAREKGQDRFLATLPKGRPLPATQPAEATGEAMHKSLQTGLKNVQQLEDKVWSGLEDYPIPFGNASGAIRAVKSIPLDEETRNAVEGAVSFINSTPKTTRGLRAIEETLNSDITAAYKAGKSKIANRLRVIRDGLRADYEAMGAAAKTGDVALYRGELVYPSKVQSEIESLERRIAAETAKPPVPDRDTIESALKERGIPFMQNRGESAEGHIARIVKDYKKTIGGDIPTLPGADAEVINKLTADKSQLQNVLSNLEPAQDVAEAISAAKMFSKEQKFERFQKGVTKKVLAFGDEIGGQKIPYEKIPQMFYSPSGWKDLVRAAGSEARARELIKPHVVDDLISKATDSKGDFSISKALDYLKRNKRVLETSGLDSEVKEIIKGQFPEEINRTLAVKRADKLTEKPYFTLQEAKFMLSRYAGTINELYGKGSVEALRDYHNLMQALARNKNVTYSGGPTTAEKLISSQASALTAGQRIRRTVMDEIATVMGAGAGAYVHGATGAMGGAIIGRAAVRGVERTTSALTDSIAAQTRQLMTDAMFDPRKAEALMEIARSARAEDAARAAKKLIEPYALSLGVMGGSEAGKPDEKQKWKVIRGEQEKPRWKDLYNEPD